MKNTDKRLMINWWQESKQEAVSKRIFTRVAIYFIYVKAHPGCVVLISSHGQTILSYIIVKFSNCRLVTAALNIHSQNI